MASTFTLADEVGRKRVTDFIAKLVLDAKKPWQLTIAPLRKQRSLQANALYWRWCSVVADETGNTADDVHEFAKLRFLPKHFVTIGDETIETRKTTTKLNTKDMSDYLLKFNAWASSEMGIMLPSPDDQGREIR